MAGKSVTVTVKPTSKIKVKRETQLGHIKEDGEEVTMSTYYRRRIKDGDLEIAAKRTRASQSKDRIDTAATPDNS